MKVKLTETGRVQEVNDSYGMRLVEQGKAIAVKTAEQPKKEKPSGA